MTAARRPPGPPLRVCVYHPTMGDRIAAEVARCGLPARVDIVHDTSVDPPDRDDLEVLVANTFPAGLLGRCRRLRWLQLTGTGVDHLPSGAPEPGLVVTNAATVPARAVAEFAWMGLLGLAKQAPQLVRQQQERSWVLPDSLPLAGSRMVLVGLGRVGAEIARRAAAFDVQVTAVTRRGLPSPLVEQVVTPQLLAAASAGADHLVLAVPDTAATRELVDERVLRALPPTAVVVNVGRAATLDTAALARALTEGRLRGALLDVHDAEPLPPSSPLWTVPNLWLTPHCAYRFPAEEQEVARLFTGNLAAFLGGGELRNPVPTPAATRPPVPPPPAASAPLPAALVHRRAAASGSGPSPSMGLR